MDFGVRLRGFIQCKTWDLSIMSHLNPGVHLEIFKMFVAARLDGFYTSCSLDKQHDCMTPFMDIGLLPTRSAKHQSASGPCSFRAH